MHIIYENDGFDYFFVLDRTGYIMIRILIKILFKYFVEDLQIFY